ncbi:arrestin domain-containing protein 17 isoform X1 [Stomoxys calcitrans]|uniref:arrestin domain-containing protein 17 isoform X1 n=2 Tax=Stomoxys calcitrans TaxID=35570 RepID=UPI0027E2EA06|nr:arrestin domain-containing protein 17 isoform X1 [Stomoxys calcitrans]XP_013118300.2 arrestin domain-containing protein 17 isoform X1 [Stomoxys calcitrans]
MPSTCKFRLNNKNGVYYSGQWVKGVIVLQTTKEKTIRNICLRILGEAKVHWSEKNSREKSTGMHEQIANYKGNKTYVDQHVVVYEEEVLPAGTYVFPCRFRLPKSCPTSCRGKYGHVRYLLQLTVDRPFRYDNVFNRPLTVLKRVDLNLNPEFKVPLQCEEICSVGCWPCATGDIIFTLWIPFGAYASGQILHYSLKIQNHSMTDITGYKVEFIECMTFVAQRPEYNEIETRTTVASQNSDDVCLRLSNRQFEGEMELPSLPADTEDQGLIRVEHYLQIEMILRGCHSNKTIAVPIFIGNVPIRESLDRAAEAETTPVQNPPPAYHQSDSSDEESTADRPPPYGDLKPPSFEEAISRSTFFLDVEANEFSPDDNFQPLYPMYRHVNDKN